MSSSVLPVVQSLPHGGLHIPSPIVDRLAIDDVMIYNECDLWVDQLFDFNHSDLVDLRPNESGLVTLGSVGFSTARCLVDANRPPDSMRNPDGAVKTQTSYGDPIYRIPLSEDEQIYMREQYWLPFHTELDSLLRSQARSVRLFLDCHNMAQRGPDAYGDPGQVRPLICIANMGDEDGEYVSTQGPLTMPPALARKARDLAEEFFGSLRLLEPNPGITPIAALNKPFSGGYILQHYTSDSYQRFLGLDSFQGYYGLMIEVNRGLFVGNQRSNTAVEPPRHTEIAAVRRRLYLWLTAFLLVLEEVH